ncbi:hypothetical protein [Microlunatus sp. Y2014]|uniref:hypothetical protein n=1 Tax=Microlunatus sp. Y2014 TaxID=3418488 RepID=UPI003DA77148
MSTSSDEIGEQPTETPEDLTPEPDTTKPAATDDKPEARSANAEAAKYRRQLRDVEAERDALTERLEAVQRQQVSELLTNAHVAGAPLLHDPADLWRHGVELASLLAEDGTVDLGRARTAAADLIRDRPHLGRYYGSGGDVGVGHEPFRSSTSWADALQGRV